MNNNNIIEFYSKHLEEYGNNVKAVCWGSAESQEIRFKVLSEIGDLKGKTVLDYGCGLGDFFPVLTWSKAIYTGYDITPKMVEAAKQKYPQANFINKPEGKYDYVLASGIFNIKESGWSGKTKLIVEKMLDMCNIGVGINFLSQLSPYKQDKQSKYADIDWVASLAKGRKFVLRHDYKPNDMTIYIYK